MKKQLLLSVFALFALTWQVANAAPGETPAGYWKTIDDVTNRVKSVIKITRNKDSGAYEGTIVKTFATPGKKPLTICGACKDDRHNKPILGMTILKGLKPDAKTKGLWKGGLILDPRNGKVYHCTVRLKENNNALIVRGYIGIPLFGRSQTWVRTTKPAA